MKKLCAVFATLSLLINSLNAEFDITDVSSKVITDYTKEDGGRPCRLEFTYDYVGKAKFARSHFHDFTYQEGQAEALCIYYYDPCLVEGATIALAYNRTRLDWAKNPFFDRKNYNTLIVSFGGFSNRVKNWTWLADVSINFDTDYFSTIGDYTTYDMLLWGRYTYLCDIGLHLGFIAQTGMKIDRIYPIIGADWEYNENWKFSLVFPVNISALYKINCNWSIALAGRVFDTRHRAEKNANVSRAVWAYRNAGAEVDLNYRYSSWLLANVHAGYTFGGKLKVANRHYEHRRNIHYNGAGYVGAEIDASF